jgi:hypothetical protein
MRPDVGRNQDRKNRNRRFRVLCFLTVLVLIASACRSETSAPENETTSTVPTYRIPEHGRLRLALADLPASGSIQLELTLTESPDASDTRSVLVVSTDGHRLDQTARRLPGTNSVLQLEIDGHFLSRGLFLIQLEAEDDHALHLRRYVLELH